MRIQIVGESFSVVGNDFDLELRHGCFHDLIDDSINHFVGIGIEEIFYKMKVVGVVGVGLISLVHPADHGV